MNYLHLAILAIFILIYSLFAVRLDKLPISSPILAVIYGILTGPLLLNLLDFNISRETYKTIAELALALVLFTDASKTKLRILEHSIAIPVRLLFIGLPLTIVFGFLSGYLVFTAFTWIELAILATMLAPTDAALGKAVVTNPTVPGKIREALNVESGLNDGICFPILFLLIAIFTATTVSDVSFQFGLLLFIKEIGIGVIIGLALTYIGDRLINLSAANKWLSDSWKPMSIIALAFSCFSLTQFLGGSGFIACFSGGILYGAINKKNKIDLLNSAEGTGDTLTLIIWIIFGSITLAVYLPSFTWPVIFYTILSLTIVRILPVSVSLISSGLSSKEKLFIGWFGPRGLASIVFAIIIFDIKLPHKETIILTVVCTIIVSIVLHGISANPLVKHLSKTK